MPANGVAQIPGERDHGSLRQLQIQRVVRSAAEPKKPRAFQIRQIEEQPRSETEPTRGAPGLGRDDPAHREARAADDDVVANGDVELREQFGSEKHAAIRQETVRVGLAGLEPHHAV